MNDYNDYNLFFAGLVTERVQTCSTNNILKCKKCNYFDIYKYILKYF
jgi:hypothetical protein